MSYLGIDLGTSSVKVILIDSDQNLLAEASVPLSIIRSKALYSEQNPHEWWDALNIGVNEIRKKTPREFLNLKAIGLTGQQHGAVCLDKNNEVIYNAILWNDGRSFKEADFLNNTYKEFKTITGNSVLAGFTAPKILWLENNEPQVFKQLKKVLLPKDYLRFRLSNELATDLSDASGTSWIDVKNRCWSEFLIEATHLDISYMPKLFEGTEITGYLSSEVRSSWGLHHDVMIVGGGGDNAAGAISVGVINDAQAMLSLGTSGVYFIANGQYHETSNGVSHSFAHCIENTWHHMGVILTAASALSWWSKITARSENDLLISAEKVGLLNQETPIFLPYLSGERTPHNNPFAKGVFFALTHSTNNDDLTNAILEGVAFAIRDCQDILPGSNKVKSLSLIGGGAKSIYWGKILANVLDKEITFHNESKIGPAFGAARLALAQAESLSISNVAYMPEIIHQESPNVNYVDMYLQKFDKFKKLYKAVQDLY